MPLTATPQGYETPGLVKLMLANDEVVLHPDHATHLLVEVEDPSDGRVYWRLFEKAKCDMINEWIN